MQCKCRSRVAGARCSPLLVGAVLVLFLAGVGVGYAVLVTGTTSFSFGTDEVQGSFVLANILAPVSYTITPSDPDWITVEPNSGYLAAGANQTVWVTIKDLRCTYPYTPGTVQGTLTIDPSAGSDIVIPVSATYRDIPTDPNVAAMLDDLPALPKPAYNACDFRQDAWLNEPNDANSPMAIQFVRITHTVGLNVYWADKYYPSNPSYNNVETAVRLCRNADLSDPNTADPNTADPNRLASIVLYYGPYPLHGWDPNYANCKGHDDNEVNYDCNDPGQCSDPNYCSDCQDCCATFAHYRQDLQRIANRLAAVNSSLDTNVQISRIFLDTECWWTYWDDPNEDAWRQAMVEAYDRAYDLCNEVFPGVPVGWYGRVLTNLNTNEYKSWQYHTLGEKSDDYQTGLLVHVWDKLESQFKVTREKMYENEPNCPSEGDCVLIPWVTFGEGFAQLPKDPNDWAYVGHEVYDPNMSWELGAWFNDPNYVPDDPNCAADEVPGVAIYGNPLRTPDFFMQFVAYVKGACGIALDDPNYP